VRKLEGRYYCPVMVSDGPPTLPPPAATPPGPPPLRPPIEARPAPSGLDPAKVTAADVAGANVELQAVPGWSVTIKFTPSGQARWTALTRDAVADSPSDQVAIVVDNLVISAPTIQDVITGDAAVSGAEMDRDAASRLGALLRSGPLPVMLVVSSIAVHR
jgi:preprotein translocase subunit SecD